MCHLSHMLLVLRFFCFCFNCYYFKIKETERGRDRRSDLLRVGDGSLDGAQMRVKCGLAVVFIQTFVTLLVSDGVFLECFFF